MSESQSLLDPWMNHTQPLFFQRLGLLSPEDRWDVLCKLHAGEMIAGEDSDFQVGLRAHFRERLALSPLNDPTRLDELAKRCVGNAMLRPLHTTMLMSAVAAGHPLDAMVDFDGLEPLRRAVAEHGSAIVLPVHARAIEAGVFAIARRLPTTLVVSQTAGVPDDPSIFDAVIGSTDLQTLRAPSPSVLIRCVKAAKRGRVLVLPPEFTSNENDLVTPFEVGGREVGVPHAYVELARRLRLPLLPLLFEQQEGRTYGFWFDGPFSADDMVGDVPAAVHSVFAMVEHVMSSDPTEWEGWYMFDRLIADGERARATAADESAVLVST